jgi:arginyl-tRNA synthetase
MLDKSLENIQQALYQCLVQNNYAPNEVISKKEDIQLDSTKDKSHGDYATNTAMRLSKVMHMAPRAIAQTICDGFDSKACGVEKVEIAGPGFINLFLASNHLTDIFVTILKEQEKFGSSNVGRQQKIDLEYVSANPTGYLHVGHGRGAAYGDSLSRIMKKAGFLVNREHYVNDAGNQITNMAHSVYERYKELFGRPCELQEDWYHGKEIITVAQKIKDEYADKFLDNFDLEFFKQFGTKELLGNLQNDLRNFNVEFDTWFSEKTLYSTGAVQNVLQQLKDQNDTYEQDGALWLKTTPYGDDKDRVIVKSDSSYTYLLPDIAYHKNKLNRGYDHLIDVLGADHYGYIARLKAAVSMVGGNSNLIDVEILQMVRVLENGEEVKMSKRSGKAITLADLMEEVGTDALRYFYVAKSLSTHMDLDLDLMKQKSNDNPVYYAQYAYARICSLFRQYDEKGGKFTPVTEFKKLDTAKVKDLALVLGTYPSLIEEIATKRLVHKMPQFIQELSTKLHSFYNNEHILVEDEELVRENLTVMKAVQIVLKDAMNLIGVSTPEKM